MLARTSTSLSMSCTCNTSTFFSPVGSAWCRRASQASLWRSATVPERGSLRSPCRCQSSLYVLLACCMLCSSLPAVGYVLSYFACPHGTLLVSLRVLLVELGCWMLASKVFVVRQRSCLRARGMPCPEGFTSGNPRATIARVAKPKLFPCAAIVRRGLLVTVAVQSSASS